MTDAPLSSKEQLYEIAAAIESRPVMGHWKHMRADKDAAAIRYAAAEIERLESCIRGLSSHAMKAAAEETRLRAALEGIREGYDGCDNCIGQACTWCLADKALRGGDETACDHWWIPVAHLTEPHVRQCSKCGEVKTT